MCRYDSIAILKAMKRNQKKLFRSSGWRMQLSGKGGASGALPHQVAAAYNHTSALQWFLDEYKVCVYWVSTCDEDSPEAATAADAGS